MNLEKQELLKKYDHLCKKTLSNKKVLAMIMKNTLEEYEKCSLEEIVLLIEGHILVNEEKVFPDEIYGINVEDKSIFEGEIVYDILFGAFLPDKRKEIELYINIEAQNMERIDYPLINRAKIYRDHLRSRQYTKYKHSHYEKVKPVISIWICFKGKEENTIMEHRSNNVTKDINGNVIHSEMDEDRIVFINLGKELSEDKLLRLLKLLLDITIKNRKEILKDEYKDVFTKKELKEELAMCNLGESVFQDGIGIGKIEGIEIGKIEGIGIGKIEGIGIGKNQGIAIGEDKKALESIQALMKNLKLSMDEAMNALDIHEEDKIKYEKMLMSKISD